MVRHDYPNVNEWMKMLYCDKSDVTRGAFGGSTNFEQISILMSLMDFYVYWRRIS